MQSDCVAKGTLVVLVAMVGAEVVVAFGLFSGQKFHEQETQAGSD